MTGSSGINGDAYFISKNQCVFAVADGASGSFDKQAASELCIQTLIENEFKPDEVSAKEYIEECFYLSNDKLLMKTREDSKLTFGTFTMGVIDKGKIYVGAVGDTPAYIYRKRKGIEQFVKPKLFALMEFPIGFLQKKCIKLLMVLNWIKLVMKYLPQQ